MNEATLTAPDLETHALARTHLGLLVARIALALPFIYHGAALAFGAFGGPGLTGFAQMGHMPLPMAALVAYGEFLGGLGVLFGVLARPASAGLIVIMLGAIVLVHLKNGYDVTHSGVEYPLTLLLLALAILLIWPGRLHALRLVQQR